MLKAEIFTTGFLENNCILVFDDVTHEGIIFDPSFEPHPILAFINTEQIQIKSILFTHGHFDHFAGLQFMLSGLNSSPQVGLHPADLTLWRDGGGSKHFRIPIDLPADPDLLLVHGQVINLGEAEIQVRHTPGHSRGSVIYYIPSLSTAVVGDLIFNRGIGRTDLDGGDFTTLAASIQTQVFTLPPDTRLIPGHGAFTTVANEIQNNPYVKP